jgi:hypothetical protein
MASMLIVTSDTEKAERHRVVLEQEYHSVQTGRYKQTLGMDLINSPPDFILIDLDRAPATGRDLGLYLRVQTATRRCLLVFLDGKPEKVGLIRELLPDAVYAQSESLLEDIRRGLTNPPIHPHVPDSVFAGYAGRPLAAKLGFKPGMVIALIDAPIAFEEKLGPLPDQVQIQRGLSEHVDMALWFTMHKGVLQTQLVGILGQVQDGKLWILWPKRSSGVESDLTQQIVRQHGLDADWVDFKVCSVDEIWSGLCFTARQSG